MIDVCDIKTGVPSAFLGGLYRGPRVWVCPPSARGPLSAFGVGRALVGVAALPFFLGRVFQIVPRGWALDEQDGAREWRQSGWGSSNSSSDTSPHTTTLGLGLVSGGLASVGTAGSPSGSAAWPAGEL